jgi:dTDP-glucose pyrophosphorylase/predicted transcriptional regulator
MHNLKNIILKIDNTMRDAINALNKESLRIVLVADDCNKLLGTVTDGDIRRALVKKQSMSTCLDEIMYRDPLIFTEGGDRKQFIKKMKTMDVLRSPVLDKDGVIVGLINVNDLEEITKLNNPVFIMAGGFGKRLMPLTSEVPKPLLKVGSKPILENILDRFIEAGFCNFFISTHYKAEMVKSHFGNGSKWNVNIQYIFEEKPLGTAGALGLLSNDISDLPMIVMNADILTKVDFKELLDFHTKEQGDATMCVREYDFQVPYGVVESKNNRVYSIKEKPIKKFFINAGIYILSKSIFKMLDKVEYLDMPQLLEKKIADSGQINMYPLHEYWLDIGQIEQYNIANLVYEKEFIE